MEGFKALGLSYKDTSIDVREMVAFNEGESQEFLLKLKDAFSIEEAMVVSTCNRTEVYYSSKYDLSSDVMKLLASFKGIPASKITSHFKNFLGVNAVKHLFEVSLGMDSQVLGDIQISNQVKKAYQQSADLGLAGPFIHRLLHTIFFANKRVVQETRLQDGTASVASVSVGLIDGFIKNISEPRIALIGLGEIGQNVLENLGDTDAKVCLVNRTKAKAEKLAKNTNLHVADFSDLENVIQENDVIISAISSEQPIIKKIHFDQKVNHKLVIDLSVPRSVEIDIDNLPGVSLYNVDQLTEKTLKARKVREKALPDADRIVNESILGFENWRNEMEVSPTIQKLKSALETIRREELARHTKINDKERELLDVVTKSMIQKVIKLPVLQLKAACKRGEAETLVGVLNDLFNLEDQKIEKE
ncbi:MAG: glutamyl-tRNA reductase [Ekhidna sp.]